MNREDKIKRFNNRTHVIGRISCIAVLVLILAVPFVMGSYLGAMPSAEVFWRGFLAIGFIWFISSIAEYIAYTPMLGAGGSYVAFITGNLINMKIPCAMNARNEACTKTGTTENEIIATLSVATSSLVTVVVLTVGVLLIIPIRPLLNSETLVPAFESIVPALFGAMAYKYYKKNIKTAILPLVAMSIVFIVFPVLASSASIMILPSGAIAIVFAYIMFRKSKHEKQ